VPDKPKQSRARDQTMSPGLWILWWAAFMVWWIALTGKLTAAELSVGALAAATSAFVAELVRVQDVRQFRPRLRWVLRARRLPLLALKDCGIVFAALWRQMTGGGRMSGAFRAFEYDIGGSGGGAAARRALLNASISITPNTYVVGIDQDANTVLVHQLVPVERTRSREEIAGKL
jgi:multisubunit Na+/H+ antiporter MnhE subunit